MRLRQFVKPADGPESGAREAQIMIGHPNNSGLQMNQVTRLYVPAFFITELRVWQGAGLVLAMKRGVSMSQDPNPLITYLMNEAKSIRVAANEGYRQQLL